MTDNTTVLRKEAEYAECYVNFFRSNGRWQMCVLNDPPSAYLMGTSSQYFKVKILVPDSLLCASTEAFFEESQ